MGKLIIKSVSLPRFYNTFTKNKKSFYLNMGPQHPAAHGVLRLIVELDGEQILNVDPHIGLLHRGTEKLIEHKSFLKAIPYFDRLDYVSMMAQEHCFVLAIEYLLNIELSIQTQYIRVLFLEITRLLNHLMSLTTHAMDVGAVTPFLWGFEEREKLMEFYERVSGARMHSNFFRPGGFSYSVSNIIINDIYLFILQFISRIDELEELLTNNSIWQLRLKNIGVVSKKEALLLGMSGPLIRSVGIPWDLRKVQPYEVYDKIKFNIPCGTKGDCYDRYGIRILEMRESSKIIMQCCEFLLKLNVVEFQSNTKVLQIAQEQTHLDMELLINHFKYYSEGFKIPTGDVYMATESPKGEFGVFLVANNSSNPARCKIKAPGFLHLQSLNFLTQGELLADLVTIIGTLDIVFGEIDR